MSEVGAENMGWVLFLNEKNLVAENKPGSLPRPPPADLVSSVEFPVLAVIPSERHYSREIYEATHFNY